MADISEVAQLCAIRVLDRLYVTGNIEVSDYGAGGKCLCETILEIEIQKAIDESKKD